MEVNATAEVKTALDGSRDRSGELDPDHPAKYT
jgi:hypothetical protein